MVLYNYWYLLNKLFIALNVINIKQFFFFFYLSSEDWKCEVYGTVYVFNYYLYLWSIIFKQLSTYMIYFFNLVFYNCFCKANHKEHLKTTKYIFDHRCREHSKSQKYRKISLERDIGFIRGLSIFEDALK